MQPTALLLTRACENGRCSRTSAHASAHQTDPPSPHPQKYEELKAEMIRVERLLLRELGFVLHVEHPHKLVVNHLHILGGRPELMQEAWSLCNDRFVCVFRVRAACVRDVCRVCRVRAVSVCHARASTGPSAAAALAPTHTHALPPPPLPRHSLRTVLCVRFKAEVIVCGIIFLAARRLKVCVRVCVCACVCVCV